MRNFEKSLLNSLVNLQSFGRLYFTPKQLYYEFCRTSRLPFAVDLKKYAPIIGKLSSLVRTPQTIETPVSWPEFEAKLEVYLQNNEIKGLLKIAPNTDFIENFPGDLMLYGLPRLLICESEEIAQMLRANQFHLQTPCGVLSLRAASPLSESFQQMFANAETPQVFFLHNASLRGFSLIEDLRQTLELKDEIPIRPLGLRPVHARRLHLFAIKTENNHRIKHFSGSIYLTESEKRWLENGNMVEVSAVSPVRLMRVLRRMILGLEIPPSDWQISLPKKNLGFM